MMSMFRSFFLLLMIVKGHAEESLSPEITSHVKDLPPSVRGVTLGLDQITLENPPLTKQFENQSSLKVRVLPSKEKGNEETLPLKSSNPEKEALMLFFRDIQKMPYDQAMALLYQPHKRRFHKLVITLSDQENVLKQVRLHCKQHRSLLLAIYFKTRTV